MSEATMQELCGDRAVGDEMPDDECGEDDPLVAGTGGGCREAVSRFCAPCCEAEEGEWCTRPSTPAGRYLRLGAWIVALVIGWLLSKLYCAAGIPEGCNKNWDTPGTSEDLAAVVVWGAALGWLNGVAEEQRARRLAEPWIVVLFLAASPVFGALGSLPSSVSGAVTSTGGNWDGPQIALYSFLGVVVLAFLAWHVVYARRVLPAPSFYTYLVSRAALTLFTAVRILIALPGNHVQMHLHHYVLAWNGAVWCSFSHPLSRALFAVLAGIFVQGLGAYPYADLFDTLDNCVHWRGYQASNFFEAAADEPFRTRLCLVNSDGSPGGSTPPGMSVRGCPTCKWAPWPNH